jgi:Putative peptidoglycan binding domain
MSRFLKGLSSLVNGPAGRSSKRTSTEPDTGPSTLTTPLFPVSDGDADTPDAARRPAREGGAAGVRNAEGAETPTRSVVPLAPPRAAVKGGRASSSRALNAVVRASAQVALPSHVEPAAPPKTTRVGHRSSVVLTETEKVRLQIMQVQLRLRDLELYDGTIDGVMNPALVEAVRHFQTLKGMRDSGMLTTGTLTALGIRSID